MEGNKAPARKQWNFEGGAIQRTSLSNESRQNQV